MRDRGARRPALLAPEPASAWAEALRGAAAAWGASYGTEVAVRTVPFAATAADTETGTRRLLEADPGIDAVICAPDGAAPGTLRAATVLGRTVGADLLVASCVDGAANRSADTPVTAVDLRPAEYGRACAALLCDILAGRAEPGTVRHHTWVLETRPSTTGSRGEHTPQ